MTDRGILYSGAMVRAQLAGTKTQTRRVLKLPKVPTDLGEWEVSTVGGAGVTDGKGNPTVERPCLWYTRTGVVILARHQVGDRLYVREEWRTMANFDGLSPVKLGERYRNSIYPEKEAAVPVLFAADDARQGRWADDERTAWSPGRRRAGMHMPRWASRLTNIVTDVRIQRLHDLTEAEAIAEGVERGVHPITGEIDGWRDYSIIHAGPHKGKKHPHAIAPWKNATLSYQSLWETLHQDEGERWADNPWVVATTFDVVRGNIDQVPA